MPRTQPLVEFSPSKQIDGTLERFNIDEHFHSNKCLLCGAFDADGENVSRTHKLAPFYPAIAGICGDCIIIPETSVASLLGRIQRNEMRLQGTHRVCASCCNTSLTDPVHCESLDCPWLYARKKAERKTEFLAGLRGLGEDLLAFTL